MSWMDIGVNYFRLARDPGTSGKGGKLDYISGLPAAD